MNRINDILGGALTSMAQERSNSFTERRRMTCDEYEARFAEAMEAQGLDLWQTPRLLAKAFCRQLDGKRGLFLSGKTGSGKTARIKLLHRLCMVNMADARKITDELSMAEGDAWHDIANLPTFGNAPIAHYDLIIDDLGTEDDVIKVYGREVRPMPALLDERYKAFINHGSLTYFTSNLKPSEIKARYGERIFSRLCEMCKYVVLPYGDHRIENSGWNC